MDPKKKVHAVRDFIEVQSVTVVKWHQWVYLNCTWSMYYMPQVILKGHITAAALHYFNMTSVDDELPPQVVGNLKQSSKDMHKVCFNRSVWKIWYNLTNPGITSAAEDGVLNYVWEV